MTSPTRLRKILVDVRRAGYALLDQELEVGLRSIAVAVRDGRGNVAAALNVSTHASRVSLDDMKERFLPLLNRCAADLGAVIAPV